jgi:SAM-dependent methyltransferase
MKLSNIVRYLNNLDTLSVRDAMTTSIAEVDKITEIVQNSEVKVGDLATDLSTIQEGLKTSLTQYEQKLKQLRRDVQSLIEQQESEYFAASTTRYRNSIGYESPDYILTENRNIDADSETHLRDRLNSYTSWQYPGMVVRPALSPGLESAVAFDPLYLVDTHNDLLDPVKSLFTPEYQRRLRYYVIQDHTKTDIFFNLPHNQFGFVYSFYYLDFKPLEIIKKYLDEVMLLLRPGGVFLFSFNDCDQWRAVGSVENGSHYYTPKRLILQHARTVGYQIAYTRSTTNGTTWMELKKSGVLNSIRGGQALAGIFRKTVDKPLKELYNAMTLDMLIDLAEFLKVDISQAKTKREFNIKKVRRTLDAHFETENYPEETLRELFKPKEN